MEKCVPTTLHTGNLLYKKSSLSFVDYSPCDGTAASRHYER